jgi:hypothetical protein
MRVPRVRQDADQEQRGDDSGTEVRSTTRTTTEMASTLTRFSASYTIWCEYVDARVF